MLLDEQQAADFSLLFDLRSWKLVWRSSALGPLSACRLLGLRKSLLCSTLVVNLDDGTTNRNPNSMQTGLRSAAQ